MAFSWLVNRGDPNHLQVLGWSSKLSSFLPPLSAVQRSCFNPPFLVPSVGPKKIQLFQWAEMGNPYKWLGWKNPSYGSYFTPFLTKSGGPPWLYSRMKNTLGPRVMQKPLISRRPRPSFGKTPPFGGNSPKGRWWFSQGIPPKLPEMHVGLGIILYRKKNCPPQIHTFSAFVSFFLLKKSVVKWMDFFF